MHPMRRLIATGWMVGALGLSLSTFPVLAEDGTAADDAAARMPNLIATFESLVGAANGASSVDSRRVRLLALHVPAGEAPTPFLPPGRFRATFEGFLDVEFFEEFIFRASGRGIFELEINGEKVLSVSGENLAETLSKSLELEGGKQRLVARYESPASGPSLLRVDWFSFDFPHGEPLPPRMLYHDAQDPRLLNGDTRRLGRDLLVGRRCLKCHQPTAEPSATAMPELAMDAPSFVGIGSRLRTQWMARWIENPQAHRAQATMPRLLAGDTARSADAAAYLATVAEPKAASGAPGGPSVNGSAADGERLFSELGCVACHRLEPKSRPDEYQRISLAHVAEKWKEEALAPFLQKPERHYAWIRMPNFQLTDTEAAQLAAYLLSATRPSSAPSEAFSGDPVRGRKVVEESGCLNCHALKTENRFMAPPLAAVSGQSGGCLSTGEAERGRAPYFRLDPAESAALRSFLAADQVSLERRSPEEFSERQFAVLRCWSCHTRDGVADVWANVASRETAPKPPNFEALDAEGGEGEKLVEQRPNLTWVGEKLRPEWVAEFLGGGIAYSVRSWFTSRMPKFGTRASLLAHGFARQHGLPIESAPPQPVDGDLAEIGAQLVQRGKFECVACHDVGDQKAVSVFDAKGTNFKYATRRLRKPFFHRWMLNPIRVSPETKMPSFASEGRSPFEIFGYDGPKQFEAVWHFLRRLGEKDRKR